ncbi:M48 family metallopeptidase [Persicitalea jodogahamensis]|uniref:Metal-dependent hydrolase n=1 Tax=Persicitalea jodogahamensis TaxID=402147 RepID=A0A8J3D8D2_9BACT|nr:SprT family zinc-dependent metalloprotease [Persicitalea jodogahamensis]GHB87779.1 metal-dependent hydrolase [Persicitalea jodogahamensis]
MGFDARTDLAETSEEEMRYGSAVIRFTVLRGLRKTLSITVDTSGDVLVKVPEDATANQIKAKVKNRAGWIIRQQERFRQLNAHATPPRRYVSGETHYYLGRQYRLKVEEQPVKSVIFRAGRIVITTPDKADKKIISTQLNEWYRKRARLVILPLFNRCLAKLPIKANRKEQVQVKLVRMEKRWGSCSPQNIIRLNPDLIRTPKGCIEYIIWHELAHIINPNHRKPFYELQDRLMPDWRVWEERLRQFRPD